MKKTIKLVLVGFLFFCYDYSAHAGLFDSLTDGLEKTVNVVNETANQAITSVSNVVDVSVSVETSETQNKDTAQQRYSGIRRLNENEERIGYDQPVHAKVLDSLTDDLKKKVTNTTSETVNRVIASVSNVVDVSVSAGKNEAQSADATQQSYMGVRLFDKGDISIQLAKLKKEQQLAYNRDREEIQGVLDAFEGGDASMLIQSGECGQLLAALMDAHLEVVQTMNMRISEIKKQYNELPPEVDDEATQRVAELKHSINQIQDDLMAVVNDAKERGEANRRLLVSLHASSSGMNDVNVEQLTLVPEVCLGDSLFSVLCNLKGMVRTVVRPSENEAREMYGQTHVIFPQIPDMNGLENLQLDFGSFGETQEVFLVRAKFEYARDAELKSVVDRFKRMLPNSVSYNEERQIVGYDEEELKSRNPWAKWQLEYYRERAKSLESDELKKKNLALVDFIFDHYHAIPFLRKKVTLKCAGYGVEMVTRPGGDIVESVTFEDILAADKVKLK